MEVLRFEGDGRACKRFDLQPAADTIEVNLLILGGHLEPVADAK